MADRTLTKDPADGSQPGTATILNLAAVSRMLHADDRVAPEEIELFEELLAAGGVPATEKHVVQGWAETAPTEDTLADLALLVPEEGRLEALGLAWVTAHADGQVVDEELTEHKRLAEILGLAEVADQVRASVEEGFFGSALTVLAALATICQLADDRDDGQALYLDAVQDMELPAELAEQAAGWFGEPRPLHEVLSEAAGMAPDFQEALLGHLWLLAGAVGNDDGAKALFARFEAACGVDGERVRQIQAEWATAQEETG